MAPPNRSVVVELERWGALPAQVVDLERDDEPRILRYLDLRNQAVSERRPVVVETAGQPRLHVFTTDATTPDDRLRRWCLRTTLRGDGAWVAVLEPGRLRVFRPDLRANHSVYPAEVELGSRHDAIPRVLYDTKVGERDLVTRRYLLDLLAKSIHAARRYGLSPNDALSIAGRGLFWRFLIDRSLLAGLSPVQICEGAESWEACLDSKSRALRTFGWLEETFNGGLLPFEHDPHGFNKEVFSKVLGNIAYGATATGQLRLPTDWREVNFAHIPVGLLSEVYEAFAHTSNTVRAQEESIHYTPRHIAEFLVSEALASVPKGVSPRVLDPAAGAGVFLVTAYRQLAEREWVESGVRPRRPKLRQILNGQIVGFDINTAALRLAELALYLTALELDPDPRPLQALRFQVLRDKGLFEMPGGIDGGSLSPVSKTFRKQFDVVVGNPPWTARPRGIPAKKRWVVNSLGIVRDRLGDQRAATFDFPDTNPDLPFLWRAMEWAKPSAIIALVTHSRWLFGLSDRLQNARRDIFEAVHVTGILNGSALRMSRVWPNVQAPFCFVFAKNEKPPTRAAFQFVSPMLDATPDAAQARIRVDWLDAQLVTTADVIERPWTLKARYRGNRLAERALVRMQECGQALHEYLASLGTEMKNGYQVGGAAGRQLSAEELHGLPDLAGTTTHGFIVSASELPGFSRRTLLRPRNRANYRGPLLLLRETIPSSRLSPRAVRCEKDVAYSRSFNGISFAEIPDGLAIVRYLQLVLQSGAALFFELLCDARYGVERDTVYLESVKRIPVVPFGSLNGAQRRRCAELAARLSADMTEELADDIDTLVFDIYGLAGADRDAVTDTLQTGLPSARSKKRALSPPTDAERTAFIKTLVASLNNVLLASNLKASVSEPLDLSVSVWRLLQIDIRAAEEDPRQPEAFPVRRFLSLAESGGASLVTLRLDQRSWLVGLLERYALWTPTRARLLATDIIAERTGRG